MGALCLYFYNQLVIRVLDERNEWKDALQRLLDRYDNHVQASTDIRAQAAAQDHALRSKIQEFMTMIENRLLSLENRLRGGGND